MASPGPKRFVVGGPCREGHMLDEANVYMEGSRVRCRTCDNERKGRQGPSKTRVRMEIGEICSNDLHLLTSENTYRYSSGKLVCKQCRIKSSRKSQGYSGNIDDPLGIHNKHKTHCPQGHEYAASNTRVRSDGSRRCIVCEKAAGRKSLMSRYGITLEDYDRMFEAQKGVCAICGSPPNGQELAVDHDHGTSAVRGLLCSHCNTGIGQLKEDVDLLRSAIDYLINYQKIKAS